VGYEGRIFMDVFPFRLDPVMAVNQSLKNVMELLRAIQETDLEKLQKEMKTHNYAEALKSPLSNA